MVTPNIAVPPRQAAGRCNSAGKKAAGLSRPPHSRRAAAGAIYCIALTAWLKTPGTHRHRKKDSGKLLELSGGNDASGSGVAHRKAFQPSRSAWDQIDPISSSCCSVWLCWLKQPLLKV